MPSLLLLVFQLLVLLPFALSHLLLVVHLLPKVISFLLLDRAPISVSSPVPDGLKYSKSHEWVKINGTTGTVGITDYAQSAVRIASLGKILL